MPTAKDDWRFGVLCYDAPHDFRKMTGDGCGARASGVMAAMSGASIAPCALLLQEAGCRARRDDGAAGRPGIDLRVVARLEDAREVCQRLGIPHDAFDLRDRFDAAVVRPFCDAYLEGRTPNPCIAAIGS